MVFLPAIAALYSSMGAMFNLPYPQQVAATIAAIIVFLGVFLQVNSSAFKLRVVKGQAQSISDAMLKLKFIVSDSVYDILKWVTTILLPAVATLYVGLAHIWNLPYSDSVSNVIAAIVLVLAAFLQVSSLEYQASMHMLNQGLSTMTKSAKGFLALSSNTYNWLKFIAQAGLPGLATFYVALATIWNLPYSDQISATIMAIVLFMNAVLQISSAKFKKAQQE